MRRSGLAAAALALVLASEDVAPAAPPPQPAPPAAETPVAPEATEAPEAEAARNEAAEKQARIDRAVALFDEARARYQRGEYRAAIVKLEEAAALDPEGKELVYNLAVIHEKLGEIPRAETYFRHYLEMETDPEARAEVEATLRRLEGAKKELASRPAESPRRPPSPEPEAPPRWADPAGPRAIRAPVLIAGGVAAGALLVSNIFALSAIVTAPGSGVSTGPGASADEIMSDARTARGYAVVADVALLVAGAAGGLALYFYLSTPPPRPAPAASTHAPAPLAQQRPFSQDAPAFQPSSKPRPSGALERGPGASLSVALEGPGARLRVQF